MQWGTRCSIWLDRQCALCVTSENVGGSPYTTCKACILQGDIAHSLDTMYAKVPGTTLMHMTWCAGSNSTSNSTKKSASSAKEAVAGVTLALSLSLGIAALVLV